MDIDHTRSMVRAALEGQLDDVPTMTDPVFGLAVPVTCPGVPDLFLQPRATWSDGEAYDRQARALAAMFVDNFRQFEQAMPASVRDAGPR